MRGQVQKDKVEEEGLKKASGGANRYGQQEVCPLSGVIVNREESRMRDHKAGRNYRWALPSSCGAGMLTEGLALLSGHAPTPPPPGRGCGRVGVLPALTKRRKSLSKLLRCLICKPQLPYCRRMV